MVAELRQQPWKLPMPRAAEQVPELVADGQREQSAAKQVPELVADGRKERIGGGAGVGAGGGGLQEQIGAECQRIFVKTDT